MYNRVCRSHVLLNGPFPDKGFWGEKWPVGAGWNWKLFFPNFSPDLCVLGEYPKNYNRNWKQTRNVIKSKTHCFEIFEFLIEWFTSWS